MEVAGFPDQLVTEVTGGVDLARRFVNHSHSGLTLPAIGQTAACEAPAAK
jgi:hypothetical protein